MKTSSVVLLMIVLMCGVVPSAAADDRADAAAAWLLAAVHGKGVLPAPKRPIKVVFDSGTQFAAGSPCAKLRIATLSSDRDMAQLAGCLQTAVKQLGLDAQPARAAAELDHVGVRYLRSWFHRSLQRQLVVPRGLELIGTSINRSTGGEGEGVAVMVHLLVNADGQVTGIYAYAGRWAYPV